MRPNNPPIGVRTLRAPQAASFKKKTEAVPTAALLHVSTHAATLCPRLAGRRWSQRALIHNTLCIHKAQSFCATAGCPPPTAPTHTQPLPGQLPSPESSLLQSFQPPGCWMSGQSGCRASLPPQRCFVGDLPDPATVLVWDQDGGGNPDPLLGDSIGLPY